MPQQQWQSGPIGGPAPSGPLPPQQQGYYQPVVVVQQQQDSSMPVIVELICDIFGIYGIGWLIAGYTTPGILLLIGGFIWAAIFWGATIITIGIGLICLVPIDIAFLITSVLMLNSRLKQRRMGMAR
jgi:hypothetical protein